MAFVDHCQTADDVRRNARETYRRARARDERLRAAAQARNVMDDNPPVVKDVPKPIDEIKPKQDAPITDAEFVRMIKRREATVRAILADMTDAVAAEVRPSVRDIQNAIGLEFGVTRAELQGPGRTQNLVVPRHISFLLCRMLTLNSLPRVARFHGGRDHTTALHGVRKYEWLRLKLEAELTAADPLEAWAARAKFHLENKAAG